MSGYDQVKLEIGAVTDGDGNVLQNEAVIYFSGEDEVFDIKVTAPHAILIAERIVNLWNGETK